MSAEVLGCTPPLIELKIFLGSPNTIYFHQNKLWHMTPIFGSSEGEDIVTLGSLEYDNPMARPIMNSPLTVVGQLFKVNRVEPRIQRHRQYTVDLNGGACQLNQEEIPSHHPD